VQNKCLIANHDSANSVSRRTRRAADRPVAAIFHFSAMPNGVSVHTAVLVGRRLTPAVRRQPINACGS